METIADMELQRSILPFKPHAAAANRRNLSDDPLQHRCQLFCDVVDLIVILLISWHSNG